MNPATKDVIVSRMMQVKGGCKLTDRDIDVLTVGGISEPKTLVVVEPEPGVLEFKTEGGTTEPGTPAPVDVDDGVIGVAVGVDCDAEAEDG